MCFSLKYKKVKVTILDDIRTTENIQSPQFDETYIITNIS